MSGVQCIERWRLVESFPDYCVSDHGRMCSRRSPNGKGPSATTWRILRGSKYKHNGYWHVLLAGENSTRDALIHILVLEAFVGPRPAAGTQACHWDGDKNNNGLDNLRWGTAKDNAADRLRHGQVRFGEASHLAKLKESDVLKIRMMRWRGMTAPTIARQFGLSVDYVYVLCSGRRWKHLKEPNRP